MRSLPHLSAFAEARSSEELSEVKVPLQSEENWATGVSPRLFDYQFWNVMIQEMFDSLSIQCTPISFRRHAVDCDESETNCEL